MAGPEIPSLCPFRDQRRSGFSHVPNFLALFFPTWTDFFIFGASPEGAR